MLRPWNGHFKGYTTIVEKSVCACVCKYIYIYIYMHLIQLCRHWAKLHHNVHAKDVNYPVNIRQSSKTKNIHKHIKTKICYVVIKYGLLADLPRNSALMVWFIKV
jgi:hypothetical protein